MYYQAVTDFVALSGQRVYRELNSGLDRHVLTQALVDVLIEAGWQVISGPTTQGNGTGWILKSRQSPWYNPENPPEWYIGNRIVFEIDNTNGPNMRFRVGCGTEDSVEFMMGPTEVFNRLISSATGKEHILACPYQLCFWNERHPNTATNFPQFAGLLVSAINLPKFVLQTQQYIHLILATNILRNPSTLSYNPVASTGGNAYVGVKARLGGGSYVFGARDIRFCMPMSSYHPNNRTGRRIWSYDNDPSMGDYTQWYPFFVPPRIIFDLPGSTPAIHGFLWDALCVSEGYEFGTIRSFPTFGANLKFHCYAGRTNPAQSIPDGSLFLCVTPTSEVNF